MKNRIIVGIFFVLIVVLAAVFNIFNILITLFLLLGLYEFHKITLNKKFDIFNIVYFCIFIIGIFALYTLNSLGIKYIGVLVALIMLNDTFAYFGGRFYGKHKFSKISPNKTVEGLVTGIGVSSLIYVIYYYIWDLPFHYTILSEYSLYISIFYIIFVVIMGNIGDILESNFKRINIVKDSGYILYGHGGILDRIDSWIFAAIFFTPFIYLLQN